MDSVLVLNADLGPLHRVSLRHAVRMLFREVADGASGWVIYRPSPDKLWKMYDSLHPE